MDKARKILSSITYLVRKDRLRWIRQAAIAGIVMFALLWFSGVPRRLNEQMSIELLGSSPGGVAYRAKYSGTKAEEFQGPRHYVTRVYLRSCSPSDRAEEIIPSIDDDVSVVHTGSGKAVVSVSGIIPCETHYEKLVDGQWRDTAEIQWEKACVEMTSANFSGVTVRVKTKVGDLASVARACGSN